MILHLSILNHDSEIYHDIWKKQSSAGSAFENMTNRSIEIILRIESPIYDSSSLDSGIMILGSIMIYERNILQPFSISRLWRIGRIIEYEELNRRSMIPHLSILNQDYEVDHNI